MTSKKIFSDFLLNRQLTVCVTGKFEVQGHTTTTEWNGKENIEEYLKKRI